MPLTSQQIDVLADRAHVGDRSAIETLVAAARETAANQQRFRVVTDDGIDQVMTAREYISMSATDLVGARIEIVE